MRNKRKLNIIKYSKNLKESLNITNKDFKGYINLKEFNNTYKTNIEDIDIKELHVKWVTIEDEGLKILNKIDFKNLKELNLSENHISNLSELKSSNF